MENGFFLKRSVHGILKTAIARLILDRLSSNSLCIFFIPRYSFFVLWLYQNHRYFTVYPKKTRKFDLALAKMTSLQKKRSYDFFIFFSKINTMVVRIKKIPIRDLGKTLSPNHVSNPPCTERMDGIAVNKDWGWWVEIINPVLEGNT